jgi:hypothetical protein
VYCDVNLLDENTETLSEANMEVGAEADAQTTKQNTRMFTSPHIVQCTAIITIRHASKPSDNVADIEFFVMMAVCQVVIQDEMKDSLNSKNACYT